jgi:Tfp pilus assembly protein PilN
MGATVAAALGAVAFLYAGQSARVGAAEEEVTAAKQKNAALSAEHAKLAYVDARFKELDDNEALLQKAKEKRIPWSRNLADIRLAIPDTVWLQSMDVAQKMDGEPTDVASGVLPEYNLGTVTFAGRAYKHDDVAAWLAASSKIVGYGNVWFTSSEVVTPTPEEVAKGDRPYVDFKMEVDISPNAQQRVGKTVNK